MNTTHTRSNERWSAIENTTSRKSSDRLKKLLYSQDFGRHSSSSGMDESSHTMPIPAIRRASVNSMGSLGSMSSISSVGSFGSINGRRFTSRKGSSSKLMRYSNRDSNKSLLSLNSRWKSTPPKKRHSTSTHTNKLLHAGMSMSVLSPVMSQNHQGRWMATVSSDSAIDRPISAIRRKASYNALFTSSG